MRLKNYEDAPRRQETLREAEVSKGPRQLDSRGGPMTSLMIRLVVSLLFCLGVGGSVSLACSCGMPGPAPCAGLKPSSVVFVGTVESIENPPPSDSAATLRGADQSGQTRYHFRIDEGISG